MGFQVNIERDTSYDVMTILRFKPDINDKIKLFTRIQVLNLFRAGGNIKSYQWFRLGLEVKGIQFGFAANLDEYGPQPSVETNFGLFVRKEIFQDYRILIFLQYLSVADLSLFSSILYYRRWINY